MAEISKYPEIQSCDYYNLKQGQNFTLENGNIIPNEELTLEGQPSKSYAFCSDTRFRPEIIPLIKNVDVLYHEATFLHDLKEMADYTGHATALEAAITAKEANVGKLILGHFSNRYQDLSVFTSEARTVFPNSYLPTALEAVKI